MEDRPADEADLVERARQADIAAFEALVQRYQQLAFRVAYQVTGDAGEAEDAAQEAFVKAFYALHRFRPGAPFRPWMLRIVANEARNRRSATARRSGLQLRAVDDRSTIGAEASPEDLAERRMARATLLQAVNQLRPDDRLVLAYRYFLDLSEADMASVLACARGTVKSRLSRALDRLRAVIDPGQRTGLGNMP